MKSNNTLSWQIGAAYIGTVIGAGFASGQEILQFFTVYGNTGIFTLLFSGALFILLGYSVFYISLKQRTYNYRDFTYNLCGRHLGIFYDILITVFLFLGSSIMFSGSGAILKETFHLPYFIGVILISVLTLLVVLKSLDGILKVNSIIVPVLTAVIIFVLCRTAISGDLRVLATNSRHIYTAGPLKPVFYMLFYCAYNTVLSIGVLSAFPQQIKDLNILKKGAFIGGAGLMLLSLFLNICLLLNIPDVFSFSVPMLLIAGKLGKWVQYAVMACVWFEIFSTAVSNIFSLSMRLSKSGKYSYKVICVGTTAAAIPLALFPFKKLISFFYPLFGAFSILLILYIISFFLYFKLRHDFTKLNNTRLKCSRLHS